MKTSHILALNVFCGIVLIGNLLMQMDTTRRANARAETYKQLAERWEGIAAKAQEAADKWQAHSEHWKTNCAKWEAVSDTWRRLYENTGKK